MVCVSALWCLWQHLQSYLGFSYLRPGVSLHGCSSKAQPLLLTLNDGYLLTATPPDLERGVAPLSPSAPPQPPLLGCAVAPPSRCPWPRTWGSSSRPLPLTSDVGVKLSFCLISIPWMLFFSHSVVSNSVTPWTAAHQASLSFTVFQSLL